MASPPPELVDRFRKDLDSLSVGTGRIGLAVSGGPDSMALLLLAHASLPGRIEAATVDHGLRAESRAEADFVANLCGQLQVPHAILPVVVDTDRSSLQQSAREARYRALDQWMGARQIAVLLTGHHADDQAETLMMRMLRGAGVAGLSAIRAATPLPVPGSRSTIVRPLLTWRRTELRAIVASADIEPVADPSNDDARYDRVRIRQILAEANWIDPLPLARSAAALSEADEALKWITERLWKERVRDQGSTWSLDHQGLPAELKRRLLQGLLETCRPDCPRPRGEEVSRLLIALENGQTATLAGVKCTGGKRWHFEPEIGRPQG
jgi:tRNA(Ile)-lysidine synthase